ncbi:MAG: RNA polymerase sigma factor [Acidobacteriota bacterium]
MAAIEESALIRRAQAGDSGAFTELVHRYDRRVLRLALNLVGSEEEARDLYQESFLRAYRALARFRFECAFGTWLFRIVSNLCLDQLRRRTARAEERLAGRRGADARGPLRLRRSELPDGDPELALLRAEMRRRIDAALARLAPRERLVFEMRHYQDMRLAAIGEALETTEATVKNCLFRAHRRLRAALSDLRAAPGVPGNHRADAVRADTR